MGRDSTGSSLGLPLLFSLMLSGTWLPLPLLAEAASDVPAEVQIIDAETLIRLAAESENLLVIDSRIRSDRLLGYIEGAISLPNTHTSCLTLAEVTTGLDQPLVFYCNGTACERSAKAVIIAHQCGFTRLYWFRGGFKEWKSKRYPYIK